MYAYLIFIDRKRVTQIVMQQCRNTDVNEIEVIM